MRVPAAPFWNTVRCKQAVLPVEPSLLSVEQGPRQGPHMLTVCSSILHSGFIFKVEIVVDLLWGELRLVLHLEHCSVCLHTGNANYLFFRYTHYHFSSPLLLLCMLGMPAPMFTGNHNTEVGSIYKGKVSFNINVLLLVA